MVDRNKQRKERLAKAKKGLSEVGRGLYRGQIDIKMAPWQVQWEYLEIMMAQQDEMIEILTGIKRSLDGMSKGGGEFDNRLRIIDEIERADGRTLKEMCKRAGLDQRGKPEALRSRLYKYYNIE